LPFGGAIDPGQSPSKNPYAGYPRIIEVRRPIQALFSHAFSRAWRKIKIITANDSLHWLIPSRMNCAAVSVARVSFYDKAHNDHFVFAVQPRRTPPSPATSSNFLLLRHEWTRIEPRHHSLFPREE
jgi:hypothetical protein